METITIDTQTLVAWLHALEVIGMVILFALGFQSGQRYG